MDAKAHRHPNESSWFILSAVVGAAGWAALVLSTLGIALLVALPIALVVWVVGMVVRAQFLGNCVAVGPSQHPRIHAMAEELCRDLGISVPEIYVTSGSGTLNAFAVRFLGRGGSHVLLMSELIDLCLLRDRPRELRAILAHELAHHALGHVSPLKRVLILPSHLVTFLPQAYSRACESSCDRVALAVTGDTSALRRGLVTLASGSRALADEVDLAQFQAQPSRGGGFFHFLAVIHSTHPLLATRVREAGLYARELGLADAPVD
jgi:Zn-dependent protease with chaperone function